jgi:hypothetical protein
MVLLSNIRYDGQARKEIKTLVKAGNQFELIVSDTVELEFLMRILK